MDSAVASTSGADTSSTSTNTEPQPGNVNIHHTTNPLWYEIYTYNKLHKDGIQIFGKKGQGDASCSSARNG